MGLDKAEEFQEEQVDELNQDTPEQEEVDEPSPEETKARKGGWTSRDEWKDAGHNPDDWKSAKNFNEFGDLLANHKTMRKDFDDTRNQFDSRLDNTRKLMEAQNKQKIEDLKAQRTQHIENADLDGANATQNQIDDLTPVNQPSPQPVHNEAQAAVDWDKANPWINSHTPKAAFAKSEFNRLRGTGMTIPESIESMEQLVRNEFPPVNERRQEAPRGEQSRRSTTPKAKTLSMKDVTPEEMKFQNLFTDKSGKLDQKAFLQSVKDSRG